MSDTNDLNYYEVAERRRQKLTLEGAKLKKFTYPTQVSLELLTKVGVAGKSVLDVGAGENTQLSEFVLSQKGEYYALDIRDSALKAQKEKGAHAIKGDVGRLPFKDREIGITHARFVLAWQPTGERLEAIKECIRVARESCYFLEWDWGSMRGDEIVRGLREIGVEVSLEQGFDPNYGNELLDEVRRATGGGAEKLEEKRFNRGAGDYSQELIQQFQVILSAAKSERKNRGIVNKLARLLNKLSDESSKGTLAPFKTPDIVAVILTK